VLHYDGAGELTHASYDFKGNLTKTIRRLAVTFEQSPDWTVLANLSDISSVQAAASAGGLLEPEAPFVTATTFDALNRPTSITKPDGSVVLPTYNEANLLERIGVKLQGAQVTTSFVTNFDYNAKGQRIRADQGDGASGTTTT